MCNRCLRSCWPARLTMNDWAALSLPSCSSLALACCRGHTPHHNLRLSGLTGGHPHSCTTYLLTDGLILPDAYDRHVQHWLQRGASVVGGCCGVGPAHIQLLRSTLDQGRGAAVAAAERMGSGKQLG